MAKHAVITSFLGQTKDRFHVYNEPRNLEEKFKMVAEIEGLTGVEVVYPYEVPSASETRALLDKYGIEIAAVNVNVKAEPEFRNGGLTSPDKAVRDKAVSFIKEAKDFAEEVGANKVTCCPLGDGYEFSFQADYSKSWAHLVETFGEAGSYKREIPLFIEYKPSETRGACFVDTASKAVVLLNHIGIKDMGVTIDFGHSMYGKKNPAEDLCLVASSGYPFYIHINDNDALWDWDYFVGTKHFMEYVEFLYYLKKLGYNDFFTSDTSPTRWDIKGTFEVNTRLTNKIWSRLDELIKEGLENHVGAEDFLASWKFFESALFNL
ncbi:sugar phosphate isomerase/epimerase family protein [Spirochaetia bacterium 38H-sp]|uniref:Sugar phosphate isomerase/epimerase family protein n=1 Tax=Rarispira pelagica TaxID=3141764 RepID=A0ABU9UBX0_9SPIR